MPVPTLPYRIPGFLQEFVAGCVPGSWTVCPCPCALFQVRAVHSTAMTGIQEPDLREQHRGPTQEEEDEEEEGEKVRVSVEGDERERRGEDEEEKEKEELPYPALAPVVLLALTQTSPPRSWCLRAVCHPYPSLQPVHLKHTRLCASRLRL